MERAHDNILAQQKSWASRNNINFTKKGYVENLADNLYEPLKQDSYNEFVHGRGDELANKMLALHSSSALVVNFFHYWRYRDVPGIALLLGLSTQYSYLHFEITCPKPKGVKGIRPHIDIEFIGATKPTAVESKFTEPYVKSRKSLARAYVQTPGIWGGYIQCKLLASQIVNGAQVFEHLDAPQLLKHILGLKTRYGENGFTLLYLWYDYKSDESSKHKKELQTFANKIETEVDFKSLTYQDLFASMSSILAVNKKYISYLRERYFSLSLES